MYFNIIHLSKLKTVQLIIEALGFVSMLGTQVRRLGGIVSIASYFDLNLI